MMAALDALIARRFAAVSVTTVAVLFAIVLASTTVRFETNDDVQMSCIAAGAGLAADADEHLLFSNVLIGRTLNALYARQPTIAWYGWSLIAAQFIAQTALLSSLLTVSARLRTLGLYGLYFLTVGTYFLTTLQFTSTACLVAQGGVVLLLSGLWQDAGATVARPRLRWGVSAALLILSSLIRWDSFQMLALLAVPATCVTLWRRFHWNRVIVCAGVWGIALLIAGTCARYDRQCYESRSDWREARAFYKRVIPFVDYGLVKYNDATRTAFDRVGWSRNDYDMLMSWFFLDPAVYRAETLTALVAEAGERRNITPSMLVAAAVVCGQRIASKSILSFAALWLAILVWQLRRARWTQLAALGTCGASLAIWVALQLLLWRTPDRVTFPLLTFPLAVSLCLPRVTGAQTRVSAVSGGLAMAGMICAVTIAFQNSRAGLVAVELHRALREDLAGIKAAGNPLLVSWAGAFPFEGILPLESSENLTGVELIHLGPTLRTPIAAAMLDKRQIDDLYRSLATDERVWLVASRENTALLHTYLREHHGIVTRWYKVFSGKSFSAYRGVIAGMETEHGDSQIDH